MQIFVRGLGWNTYTIDIEPEDMILTLKHRVQDRTGIRSTLQRLIFAGKQLEDKGPASLPHSSRRRNNTLADYKIRRESTVHLHMRMCHEVQNARTKPGHRRRAHSQASQNASTGPEQRRRARPQAPPPVLK